MQKISKLFKSCSELSFISVSEMVEMFVLIRSGEKLAFISPCLFNWFFLTFWLLITMTAGLEAVQFLYISSNLCNHWAELWLYPLYRALYFPQDPGQAVVDVVCHGNTVVSVWYHCGKTVVSVWCVVISAGCRELTDCGWWGPWGWTGRAEPDDGQETTLSDQSPVYWSSSLQSRVSTNYWLLTLAPTVYSQYVQPDW